MIWRLVGRFLRPICTSPQGDSSLHRANQHAGSLGARETGMPYTPLQVANTFVIRHGEQSRGLDHMKLQKLDYFVHGWWLAYHQERLLTERPQVWKYGPVF